MMLVEGNYFDHYLICSYVAQGGTGDVYKACDILTGQNVALKTPKRAVILDAAAYEQFLREIEAMRVLQHPTLQLRNSARLHESRIILSVDCFCNSAGNDYARHAEFIYL
ncbi:MAG: hypothetical protein ABI700_03680 [Chloroflexota bacterium]